MHWNVAVEAKRAEDTSPAAGPSVSCFQDPSGAEQLAIRNGRRVTQTQVPREGIQGTGKRRKAFWRR